MKTWDSTGVSKSNIGNYIKNHFQDLYAEIEKRTIKLNAYKHIINGIDRGVSIFERIYCLKNNLDDRPMCIECNVKHVSGFASSKNCYSEYCSQDCQRHSSIQIQRGLKKKREIYGEDDPNNSKKAHQTRIDKYGSHHPKDYPAKVKATKLKKHGNENYVNVEKIRATVKNHIEENPNYYIEIQQKAKKTNIANGHDPNWNNREKFKETLSTFTDEKKNSIKEMRRKTCLDCYGHEFATQSDEVKAKTKESNLKNYGVESTLLLPKSRKSMKRSAREKAWKLFNSISHDVIPLISKEDFIDNSCQSWKTTPIKWKCKTCGYEFDHAWNQHIKCQKCFPANYRGMQNEVFEFVRSLCNGHTAVNDCKSVLKDAKQLDIYISDLGFAVEFNGCFWHNCDKCAYDSKKMPMMYHYSKSIECKDKGIHLIHIWEDEWLYSNKLCKSKLKKLLCPDKIIHIAGEKCIVEKLEDDFIKAKLLSKYSFYGNDGSSVQYCLKHNDHIVAMMTFSKTRNNKKWEWQILNYIEVNSFIVDDGFKTLLDAFANDVKPTSVCLYASFDWNSVDDYTDVLDFIKIDNPRLFWTYDRHRVKDSAIDKKKMKTALKSYDESKTFVDNMNSNGYYRTYDSGTLMFCKTFR